MTDEEKKKFLKTMGYSGSCMHRDAVPIEKQPLEDKEKKAPKKRLGMAFRNNTPKIEIK